MAKREITKLFGNRVALEVIEEEYKGLLVITPTASKMHVLSKVRATGDKCPNIKTDDILFWQTNAMIEQMNRYSLNGVAVFVLNSGDMVAKLTSREIKLETFQVINDWVLVQKVVIQPSKRIIVPDQVADANQDITTQFLLLQKGETVEHDIKPGDDLIVDRARANPIKIGDTNCFYLHKNFVLGVVA